MTAFHAADPHIAPTPYSEVDILEYIHRSVVNRLSAPSLLKKPPPFAVDVAIKATVTPNVTYSRVELDLQAIGAFVGSGFKINDARITTYRNDWTVIENPPPALQQIISPLNAICPTTSPSYYNCASKGRLAFNVSLPLLGTVLEDPAHAVLRFTLVVNGIAFLRSIQIK